LDPKREKEMETCEFTPLLIVAEEEDDRLRDCERDIMSLVRLAAAASDIDCLQLPEMQLTLSTMEIRAFLPPSQKKNSFREDYDAIVRTLVSIYARLHSETEAYRQCQETTACLWQSHATALAYLTGRAKDLLASCAAISRIAVRRAMVVHMAALDECCGRLNRAVEAAEAFLQEEMSAPADDYLASVYLPEERFVD
jgi:hypothetical protein